MVEEKRLSKMSNEEIKEISHNFCNELLRQYIDQYGLESYRLVLAGKAKDRRLSCEYQRV